VESSSYARANESSLTLPVMPRSRRTPKGTASSRNQEPRVERRRQADTRAWIRSAFHHQGLSRLGATPLRDAVTLLVGVFLVVVRRFVPALGRVLPPFHLESSWPGGHGAIRGLDMRRSSLTLRERGPHARRHLNGFCSSTFKDQRTSTPAGAESCTPRAVMKVCPPRQHSQRDVPGDKVPKHRASRASVGQGRGRSNLRTHSRARSPARGTWPQPTSLEHPLLQPRGTQAWSRSRRRRVQ